MSRWAGKAAKLHIVMRPPRAGDADDLASRLRAIDAREIAALTDKTPAAAVQRGIDESRFVLSCEVDGRLMCVFGAVPENLLGRSAIVWMLCAEGIEQYSREFLRRSKPLIEALDRACPLQWNWVHSDNAVAIRWLQWCGFTIGPATALGRDGELFRRFTREAD